MGLGFAAKEGMSGAVVLSFGLNIKMTRVGKLYWYLRTKPISSSFETT